MLDELEVLFIRDALREYAHALKRDGRRMPGGPDKDSVQTKLIKVEMLSMKLEKMIPFLQSFDTSDVDA